MVAWRRLRGGVLGREEARCELRRERRGNVGMDSKGFIVVRNRRRRNLDHSAQVVLLQQNAGGKGTTEYTHASVRDFVEEGRVFKTRNVKACARKKRRTSLFISM
jgi:hypothetical protein